jgi:hypothetical protein
MVEMEEEEGIIIVMDTYHNLQLQRELQGLYKTVFSNHQVLVTKILKVQKTHLPQNQICQYLP